MKSRVRAIIVSGGALLTIKRVKFGQTHWKFPGGKVEFGENHERALVRECKEELGLDVKVLDRMFENLFVHQGYAKQMEYFYRCDVVGGQLGTGNGPEYAQNSRYEGTHEPQWIKLSELPNLDLRPLEIKNKLLNLG